MHIVAYAIMQQNYMRTYMCTNGSFACASGMQIMHAKRQAGKKQSTFPRILVKSRYRHEEVSSLLEIMRRGAALRDFWFR